MNDVEQMTDALDREIAEALAVDPSPQFVARVRQRVSVERSSPQWTSASLKIAAVLVLGLSSVVVWQSRREPAPLRSRALGVRVTQPIVASNTIALAAPTAPVAHRSARPEPEILVDRREAHAMRTLIAEVVAGRIDLAPLLDTATAPFLDAVTSPETETGVPQ